MSNRPRIRPRMRPAASAASRYQCGHCSARVRHTVYRSVVLVDVLHDDGCPVLRGTVSPLGSALRAMTRPDDR